MPPKKPNPPIEPNDEGGEEENTKPKGKFNDKTPEEILASIGMTMEVIEQGSRKALPGPKKCALLVGQFYKKNGAKPTKKDGRMYSMYKKLLRVLGPEGEVA